MTKEEKQELQKSIYEMVDEVTKQVPYKMKLDTVTKTVNLLRASREVEFPFAYSTLRDWIKKYLMETKYYDFSKPLPQDCLVYGIFVEGELVYIGKTTRGLEARQKEHIASPREPWCTEEVEFKVLCRGEADYEISLIESILIDILKPKYNKSSLIELKSSAKWDDVQTLCTGVGALLEIVLKDKDHLSMLIGYLLRYESIG